MILVRKYKLLRYFLLLLLAISGLILGYIRWTYVILWDAGFYLTQRYAMPNVDVYPNNWSSLLFSLQHDPRWLSLIIYSIAPVLLSLGVVYLGFFKKEYLINTLFVYAALWGIIILLSIISLFVPSYNAGIGLAQNIKNLAQMPFITLLLVAGFKVSEKLKS